MRALLLLVVTVAAVACARRLPPYRGDLPPPLPRARGGEVPRSPDVPPPPGDAALDLRAVASVGVRFEYDGREEGPYGASQPLEATHYLASQRHFLDGLRDALRGRTVPVGAANGEEDLLVTVVLRTMRVHHEECESHTRWRRSCSGSGSDRSCDWEDEDYETCTWPISLGVDILTSHRGSSGPVVHASARVALGGANVSEDLHAAHASLARDVASLLIAGGLP